MIVQMLALYFHIAYSLYHCDWDTFPSHLDIKMFPIFYPIFFISLFAIIS